MSGLGVSQATRGRGGPKDYCRTYRLLLQIMSRLIGVNTREQLREAVAEPNDGTFTKHGRREHESQHTAARLAVIPLPCLNPSTASQAAYLAEKRNTVCEWKAALGFNSVVGKFAWLGESGKCCVSRQKAERRG
jgi:hypothetical protein